MQSRAPFVFIILTVTLDAMGIGLILPVMPDLIRELRGTDISDAAFWGGLLAFTYALMQFLCGPLLGNLSDRYGRRPILIGSLFFLGIDYLLTAVAPTLFLVFLARFIAGITGATHPTANAYLADISQKRQRSANFGLVGAAFGVGFILGPALGGVLGELGPRAPFWAAGLLAIGNAIFGFFMLPETLKPENRRPFEPARANPFKALLRLHRLPQMGGMVVVYFLYIVSNYTYAAIWSYYTIAQFKWSPGMVGISLAAFGLCSAIVQGWLIRRLLMRLGEYNTAIFGLAMHILALSLLTVINAGYLVFVFMPLIALSVVVGPAMQGMMANRVGDDVQGEVQGVLGSVNAIAVVISPLAMTLIFRHFTAPGAIVFLPGAPFMAAAFLAIACLTILVRSRAVGLIDSD